MTSPTPASAPLHDASHSASGNGRASTARASLIATLMSNRQRPDEFMKFVEKVQQEKEACEAKLTQLQVVQEQMREEITALCAPEHYGCVITRIERDQKPRVHLQIPGMSPIRAEVHPDIDPARLRVGLRGYVSKARNCLLDISEQPPDWKDIGLFEERLDNGRILIKHQEQLIALTPVDGLATASLVKGDRIGFDRDGAGLAYVQLPSATFDHLFADDVPKDNFSGLGGLEKQIRDIQRAIDFRFKHPDIASRYHLPQRQGILLDGPPGNGKTRLARCVVNYLHQLQPGVRSRFMSVTGSEDYSMWLGGTEARLRDRFSAVRKAAQEGPVVLFIDEIDALGRRRGSDYGSGAPDRILSTLLGFMDDVQQTLDNVVIIAATNRSDQLDPGLTRPGRLDLKLKIPPPGRRAADAILRGYLDRRPLAEPPDELVQPLVSALFSPRGTYAEMLVVKLNDGRLLTIPGRELISGAVLEAIVRRSAAAAADREAQSGVEDAIRFDDLAESLEAELLAAASLLSPANLKSYIQSIPHDAIPVDVRMPSAGRGGIRQAP